MHHPFTLRLKPIRLAMSSLLLVIVVCAPELSFAQASPFMTGAAALQTNILAWLTPVAIILIMVLGGMAMANRVSWGWCIGAILGIAIAFGAPSDSPSAHGERGVLRTTSRGAALNETNGSISHNEHFNVEPRFSAQTRSAADATGYDASALLISNGCSRGWTPRQRGNNGEQHGRGRRVPRTTESATGREVTHA